MITSSTSKNDIQVFHSTTEDIIFVPKAKIKLDRKNIKRILRRLLKKTLLTRKSDVTAHANSSPSEIVHTNSTTTTTRNWGEWWSRYYETLPSKYCQSILNSEYSSVYVENSDRLVVR